jgi:hypothetical protein
MCRLHQVVVSLTQGWFPSNYVGPATPQVDFPQTDTDASSSPTKLDEVMVSDVRYRHNLRRLATRYTSLTRRNQIPNLQNQLTKKYRLRIYRLSGARNQHRQATYTISIHKRMRLRIRSNRFIRAQTKRGQVLCGRGRRLSLRNGGCHR